jgi:hypothetical protein
MNKKLSKLQSEAVLEFDKKYVIKSNAGTGLLRYTDADKIKQFLSDQIQKAVGKTLDLIATDQGWEESRDIYADALGLPLKYPKLMEDYKKRNHIKGKIVLDCQKLSIQSKEKMK